MLVVYFLMKNKQVLKLFLNMYKSTLYTIKVKSEVNRSYLKLKKLIPENYTILQ